MTDDGELDQRRRQRFSNFEDQLKTASLGALDEFEAVVLGALVNYSEAAGTPANNARPLLEACAAFIRANAAVRRQQPSEDQEGLATSIDEQLTVLTPAVLHRVGDVLATVSAEYASEDPVLEDEVLVLLARLTAVINGERQAQQERAGELEAELEVLLDDDPGQSHRS